MKNSEISRMMDQKQRCLLYIKSAYSQISDITSELDAHFFQLYPHYEKFDLYEITNVDFWFGDIALNYYGKNYALSDALFKLNNQLRNVDAFDLNISQLVSIYNLLSKLCHEVYMYPIDIVSDINLTVNDMVYKFRKITDYILETCEKSKCKTDIDLCEAIQKFYVLIDFALYRDGRVHNNLRETWRHYIKIQSLLYGLISAYEKKIEFIDERLEE